MLTGKGTELKGMAQSQTQLQLIQHMCTVTSTVQQPQLRKSSNVKKNDAGVIS